MTQDDVLTDPGMFTRYSKNPILKPEDIPFETRMVFNPGATKWKDRYVMVFRADWGDHAYRKEPRGIRLGLAYSDDGVHWDIQPKPIDFRCNEHPYLYDPRLTVLDEKIYMCFAAESAYGVCGGVAVTEDFEHFEILYISPPDNRNFAIFPERINGMICRLERPMSVYSKGGGENFDIWMSMSPDGRYWGTARLVLGCDQVPYCNSKIGPSAPPVKTPQGWLTLIHVVRKVDTPSKGWEPNPWQKQYGVGAILLDLHEPWNILGMSDGPVMWPDEAYYYEMDGFRGTTIFPCGMMQEGADMLRIYYGASDTYVGTATASISELLDRCVPVNATALIP